MALMISDEVGREIAWMRAITCAVLNAATGLAAIGTVVTLQSLGRSWRSTLFATCILVSAAATFAWAECSVEGKFHLSQAVGLWLLPCCLQVLFAEVCLHTLRPLISWDQDVRLLRTTREFLESRWKQRRMAATTLRRWVWPIRWPTVQMVVVILRRLRVPLLLLVCFDAYMLAGLCLIHFYVHPILFDVLPRDQFIVAVSGLPILFFSGPTIRRHCDAHRIHHRDTALCALDFADRGPRHSHAALERDLIWAPIDAVDLLETSV